MAAAFFDVSHFFCLGTTVYQNENSWTPYANGPSCTVGNGDWLRGVYTASSRHPTIVNVLLADGSVRQIGNNIDLRTWWGLGTRAGEETLGEF